MPPRDDVDEVHRRFPGGLVFEVPVDCQRERRDWDAALCPAQFGVPGEPPTENDSIQHDVYLRFDNLFSGGRFSGKAHAQPSRRRVPPSVPHPFTNTPGWGTHRPPPSGYRLVTGRRLRGNTVCWDAPPGRQTGGSAIHTGRSAAPLPASRRSQRPIRRPSCFRTAENTAHKWP